MSSYSSSSHGEDPAAAQGYAAGHAARQATKALGVAVLALLLSIAALVLSIIALVQAT